MMKPEEQIMFAGRDWQLVKAYLLDQRDKKISMLCGNLDHDSSNRVRGALQQIQALLAIEPAA